MLDGRLQRINKLTLAVARREPQTCTPICVHCIAMLVHAPAYRSRWSPNKANI